MSRSLSADDLLAGAGTTHRVEVPGEVLHPDQEGAAGGAVTLRPLTVADVQRIAQAAKEQRVLSSLLMVQQSLVDPKLSIDQVSGLSAGLLQFLLEKVNRLSGLSVADDDLERAVKAPLARACFVLSREFGWTPADCSALTVGQIMLYLEMLARDEHPGDGAP